MDKKYFQTEDKLIIPEVNEAQMREVDRIAVEDFGLGILQMMENAGRNLAEFIMEKIGPPTDKSIVILAGSGGNGGGGICCARPLHNHGYAVKIFLTKNVEDLTGAARTQLDILIQSGITPSLKSDAEEEIKKCDFVIDALIGYSLKGAPRGMVQELIQLTNLHSNQVFSLDIPSGIDSSNGETHGEFIRADATMTLALPKPGNHHAGAGEIYLADIGIPPEVYKPLDIHFSPLFKEKYRIKLNRTTEK